MLNQTIYKTLQNLALQIFEAFSFVDCESFIESNSPDIFALYETNLDDSNDSGNFSLKGNGKIYAPWF